MWQRRDNTSHAPGDPLAIIYNENQWKLNKVSPLYNLQYTSLKLKQYATRIRQALVGAVAANAALKYTVQCEEQPRLKYSEDDPNGLMITVSSAQENGTKAKVAYAAILLSWGVSSTVSGATHLPFLLERGEQRVGTAVKSMLQTVFDCNIQPFLFMQHHLLQFGFNFVENISRGSDPFTFSYRTPQVDHKDKLNLTFDVEDVHMIWNGITQEHGAKRSELVNLAYQILQNQIYYMIKIDISVFDLCEISLPKAEVKSSGIVKMKTPEDVNSVFTVLNELGDIELENNISNLSNDSTAT